MVFPKGLLRSAVFGGIIGGIAVLLSIKLWDATRTRRETREDLENKREEPIALGVQESTKLAQEHDEDPVNNVSVFLIFIFQSQKRGRKFSS